MSEIQKAKLPGVVSSKKRYEWIDNARVIAVFCIMYLHIAERMNVRAPISGGELCLMAHSCVLGASVPFFLILTAYLLSRKITWRKAFERFIWLFIPFVIWNILYFIYKKGCLPCSMEDIPAITGVNGIVTSSLINLFPGKTCVPIDGPSWFLRDLMALSLLTPLLVKIRKFIPLLLLAYFSCSGLKLATDPCGMLAPAQVACYLIGVALVDFKIDEIYKIFNAKFVWIAATALGLMGVSFSRVMITNGEKAITFSAVGTILGVLLLSYFGVLIERYLPRLSSRLAPCAPACFLVFMLHWPIFSILLDCYPALSGTYWILLLPIPVFFLIIAFFFAMKNYTPFLLPYLAHMKLPKKIAR